MKIWLASLVSIGLLASCGKKKEGGGTEPATGAGTSPVPSGLVTINGSGATFQKPFQEVAIEAFKKRNPSITVNYGGGGSGKGRQDFADTVTDFGCSDAPY